jgi:hypothetical protein
MAITISSSDAHNQQQAVRRFPDKNKTDHPSLVGRPISKQILFFALITLASTILCNYSYYTLFGHYFNGENIVFVKEGIDKSHIPAAVFQYESSREKLGSWLGNTWIPPNGWRHFSAQAMTDLYKDKTILWIGDSTSRRGGLTMFEIFDSSNNATTPHIDYRKIEDTAGLNRNQGPVRDKCILINEKRSGNGHPNICRRIPGGGSGMLILREPVYCNRNMGWFFQHELELLKNYYSSPSTSRYTPLTINGNVIIISIGPWEVQSPFLCLKHPSNKTVEEWIDYAVDMVESFQRQTNITILWKTCGFVNGDSNSTKSEFVRMMNN